MSSVTLANVTKSYNKKNVLENINLHISDGEFVTILGPSGCGKSTILRIVTGLVAPDVGDISIDDAVINNVSVKDRNVGMVFQQYALFPNLTAYENIAFGLRIKKLPAEEIKKEVEYLVKLVGLEEKQNNYPAELSGGQQQRVALARALAVRPKVLLLDEPLSALDAQIRKKLQKQLRQIQQELNMTMVLVTHDQEEAMTVSDRIVIMNAGKIEQIGTPTEVYTKPSTTFIAQFIGSYNLFTAEQVTALLPTIALAPASYYALRPELVHVQTYEGYNKITAVVKDIVMTGNILKIELEANGVSFHSEQLHQQQTVAVGDTVEVFVSPSDVIPVQ
jgi:putative spermidine/putrescine transport system ATP-binding protein